MNIKVKVVEGVKHNLIDYKYSKAVGRPAYNHVLETRRKFDMRLIKRENKD